MTRRGISPLSLFGRSEIPGSILVVNPHNLGGSASFNRGVEAARGRWIVNLDADDWIAPEKVARQLEVAQREPDLAIIGTWVNVIDEHGQRHPKAAELESFVNRTHLLNSAKTWVGQNPLCRSSTMVRRSVYPPNRWLRPPDGEGP